MEDERPLTDYDSSNSKCCICAVLKKILSTGKNLQTQRRCGCLGIHPRWLQRLADVRLFVFVICIFLLVFTTLQYYLVGVITTLERRFGYSSVKTGSLMTVAEVAFILVTTFVSHFTRNLNRPRFLAITGLIGALGGFVFAMPHFIYDKTDFINVRVEESHLSNSELTCMYLNGPGSNASDSLCHHGKGNSSNDGSYFFFVLGAIMIGVGMAPLTSLSVTYVDDCAGPKRVALFLGFMKMMRPLGPVLAFVFGSIFTSKYETLKDPGFDQSDPRWIGAWWIGYLVIPCLLAFISLTLLPLFPHLIPRCPQRDKDAFIQSIDQANNVDKTDAVKDRVNNHEPRQKDVSFKEFFRSIGLLLKNPVYMMLQLGGCMSIFIISGFFPFVPKYFEVIFYLPASKANLLTGMAAFMAALGVLAGAVMSSKLNWSSRQCAFLVLVVDIIFGVALLCIIPVHCSEIKLADTSNSSCLSGCACQPEQYHPVCGEDGQTYLSPCHAGCVLSHANSTWSQCKCIAENITLTSSDNRALLDGVGVGQKSGGMVETGTCTTGCQQWILFACYIAIGAFVIMTASVPSLTILLRSVSEDHRAIAIGFAGFFIATATFAPGPLIYGKIIDSTCLIWREECGQKEECMIYDQSALRKKINLLSFIFKLLAGVFYLVLWMLLRKKEAQEGLGEQNSVRYYGRDNNEMLDSTAWRQDKAIRLRV